MAIGTDFGFMAGGARLRHAVGRHARRWALVATPVMAAWLPVAVLGQEMHQHHAGMTETTPTRAGQGAFAAIQEIVAILQADPATDWSKVNIDALRQHLIDMDNVTLRAGVTNEPIPDGMKFTVTGTGGVRDSIQRMTAAHAATIDGVNGWHFEATDTADGAVVLVHAPAADIPKLRGLGFIGVLTLGMHHQHHHLMIARGDGPHH